MGKFVERRPSGVSVMYDGDDAGMGGALKAYVKLLSRMPFNAVRIVRLESGQKPEDLSPMRVFGHLGY